MTILRDVLAELFGMFLGDLRLVAAVFGVVLLSAGLIEGAGLAPLLGGVTLLCGCLLILVCAVLLPARRRRAPR